MRGRILSLWAEPADFPVADVLFVVDDGDEEFLFGAVGDAVFGGEFLPGERV